MSELCEARVSGLVRGGWCGGHRATVVGQGFILRSANRVIAPHVEHATAKGIQARDHAQNRVRGEHVGRGEGVEGAVCTMGHGAERGSHTHKRRSLVMVTVVEVHTVIVKVIMTLLRLGILVRGEIELHIHHRTVRVHE